MSIQSFGCMLFLVIRIQGHSPKEFKEVEQLNYVGGVEYIEY